MSKKNRRIQPVKKAKDFSKVWLLLRYCKIFLVFSSLAALLAVVGFYTTLATNHFLSKPVNEIVINSRFDYVDRATIEKKATSILGQSFIRQNIHQLQEELESIPWVDTVSLSRSWPDKLTLTIYEQAPIARWGSKGFVNVRGQLVFTPSIEQLYALPELKGSNDDVILIMDTYALLAKKVQPYDIAISFLQKDERESWRLQLDNGWDVVLGRGDMLKKLARLTQLFDQQLLDRNADVVAIDMRYSNGLAIQWNRHQEESLLNQEKKVGQRFFNSLPKRVNLNSSLIHDEQYETGSHKQFMAQTRG